MKSINFIVTNKCNAQCDFCFEHYKDSLKLQAITTEVVDSALIKFFTLWKNDREVISIDLFGGEPTLNQDMCIYIIKQALHFQKAYKVKLRFILFTNAFIYANVLVDFVKANPGLPFSMQISNEGFDNTSKDNGNLTLRNKIIEHIKQYVNTKIPFTVRATMSSKNLSTAENLLNTVKLMVDLGVTSFYYFPIMEYGWEEKHFTIWKDGFALITDYLIELYKQTRTIHFQFSNYVHDMLEDTPVMCSAGKDYISVYPDGEVYACQRFLPIARKDSISMGHINSELVLEQIGKTEAHEDCRNCKVKNCKICPAVSYKKEGHVYSILKNEYCIIRGIFWDEYMRFFNLMIDEGIFEPITDNIKDTNSLLRDIEVQFYSYFGFTGVDIQTGYIPYRYDYSLLKNVSMKLETMLLQLQHLLEQPIEFNRTLSNETEIVEHLANLLEVYIFEVWKQMTGSTANYKYVNLEMSLMSIFSMLCIITQWEEINV